MVAGKARVSVDFDVFPKKHCIFPANASDFSGDSVFFEACSRFVIPTTYTSWCTWMRLSNNGLHSLGYPGPLCRCLFCQPTMWWVRGEELYEECVIHIIIICIICIICTNSHRPAPPNTPYSSQLTSAFYPSQSEARHHLHQWVRTLSPN